MCRCKESTEKTKKGGEVSDVAHERIISGFVMGPHGNCYVPDIKGVQLQEKENTLNYFDFCINY